MMRQIFVEVTAATFVALSIAGGIFGMAWFTVLPSVGLLWLIGWLK